MPSASRLTPPGRLMDPRKSFPLYVFVLAFVIRLGVLTATYENKESVRYFEDVGIAINLLEGKGYALSFTMMEVPVPLRPTAAKPPVYPLLVSLVFFVLGSKNFFWLFLVHAIVAASTSVLLYSSVAIVSYYKAVIVSLMYAIYPPFVYHSVTVPESTTVMLCLICVFCYGLVKLHKEFGRQRLILTSTASGILTMTEPIAIPFIFCALFYVIYLSSDSWKRLFLEMTLALCVFAATIAPWSLRNYLTFNDVVLIKSNFGSSLKDSMYKSGVRLPTHARLSLVKELPGMNEVEEDGAVKKAMLSWIMENPLAYVRLLPKHFMNFWWEIDRYKNNRTASYYYGRKLPYIALLALGVPSLIAMVVQLGTDFRRQCYEHFYDNVMLLLMVTFTAIYTVVGAWNLRYHFPAELGMFIPGAETILYFSNKLRLSNGR